VNISFFFQKFCSAVAVAGLTLTAMVFYQAEKYSTMPNLPNSYPVF
jgi:hypothetical protein